MLYSDGRRLPRHKNCMGRAKPIWFQVTQGKMAKDIETESFQEFPIGSQAVLQAKITFPYGGRGREGEREREREINTCTTENCVIKEAFILHTCSGK